MITTFDFSNTYLDPPRPITPAYCCLLFYLIDILFCFFCKVKLIEAYKNGVSLSSDQVNEIINQTRSVLERLPNVLDINIDEDQDITIVVCSFIFIIIICWNLNNYFWNHLKGDTHGQYFDALHVFEMNGFPSRNNLYLINGDWVDRGYWGCEVY